ncbi:hypothetical protein HU200_018443 [Digitaria exilis]|uniref:Uncharacterized protein n=1 Tax=Digitaria exilis TaxID=1010633 RepID=A0A835F4E5_9POAL|nr:hypothetical protein HU200_018443 [Digitaria exilis]
MVSAISPTYDIKTRRIGMRWKGDDHVVVLVLVLALEHSWIILYNHEKVLRHMFWPS